MKLFTTSLFMFSAAVATASANDLFGLSPQEFTDRVNKSVVDGGGLAGFAKLGRCSNETRSCELTIYGGVVTGTIAASQALDDIEGVQLFIGPSNDQNGVFFAAVAASMEVLAGSNSTSEQRGDAIMNIVQTITTKDVVVEQQVGGYKFLVDAMPKVGIRADIHIPVSFNQLDRFKVGS